MSSSSFRLLEARDLDDLLLLEAERRRAEAAAVLMDEVVEPGGVAVAFDHLVAGHLPAVRQQHPVVLAHLGDARQHQVARCGLGINENQTTASPSRSAATTHWLISASLAHVIWPGVPGFTTIVRVASSARCISPVATPSTIAKPGSA